MPEWIADILKQAVAIILAVSPLLIPQIRDFVAKQIQLSFDKALEDKKAINERKNHISKVKFDKEFELYQNISHNQIEVIYDCSTAVVIARGGCKDSAQREEFLKDFLSHLGKADTYLKCYAPFISIQVFENYKDINKKAREIAFLLRMLNFNTSVGATGFKIDDKEYTNASAKEKIEELQKQITRLLEETHYTIRTHLDSLEKI